MLSSRPLEAHLPAWGVSALESHHARDFQTVFGEHSFFQLLYVLRGRGELICPPERRFSLQEGDVALLPAQASHGLRDEVGAPLSIYAVNIEPSLLAWLSPALLEPKRLRREALQRAMPDLLRRLLLEQTLRKEGFEAMMSGLVLQLLASVWRALPPIPVPLDETPTLASLARVQSFRAELERNFYKNQTVDEVAARLRLSRRAFTSLFRRATGDSFASCVKKLRVQHAQRLLETGDRTVLAIAFECGFEDVSSFHRAFKAVAGTSPDAWRKQRRS